MSAQLPNPQGQRRSKATSALSAYVQAERLMQIALVLPSSAFVGWLAGLWLDEHLRQNWIGIAGIVFGGISGLVYVARMALAASKNSVPVSPPAREGEVHSQEISGNEGREKKS
ncbi:MAG: AtpZ/AtpI family protein [Terracidiphilus sp.]